MKAFAFVAAAQKAIGDPYWYACYGQIATQALLDYKSITQYPAQYAAHIAKCKTQFGRRVWDCVGLIKGIVWENDFGGKYQAISDKSADGMFALCYEKGPISTIPEIPGLVLHLGGHIGIYEGAGKVIEARSFGYGVVRTLLKDRFFTEWGKCHLIDYSVAPTDWQSKALELESKLSAIAVENNSLKQQVSTLNASVSQLNGKVSTQSVRITSDKLEIDALKKNVAEVTGMADLNVGLLKEARTKLNELRLHLRSLIAFTDEPDE